MFSPEVYLRLMVRANEQLWPWFLVILAVFFSVPILAQSPRCGLRRLSTGLMGFGWLCSGTVFLIGLYGPINWPALYFGWAFILQGGTLVLLALFATPTERLPHALSLVAAVTMCILPLLFAYQASDWRALAIFGISPEVTAAVSVLLLLSLTRPWRWLMLIVPMVWSLFAGLVYWGLGLKLLMLIPALALVFVMLALKVSPTWAQTRD